MHAPEVGANCSKVLSLFSSDDARVVGAFL